VVVRVHKTSLAFVDTLDMLIDRYLPDPDAKSTKNAATATTTNDVVPRLLHMPFKIQARMIRITIVRAQDGYDLMQIKIKWAVKLTNDQKAKLTDVVLSKTKTIVDRASSSSLVVALQQAKQDPRKKAGDVLQNINATCYVLCDRFYVIEVKDWAIKKVDTSMELVCSMLTGASQRVYDVTLLIAGQNRATGIFTMLGKRLPFVKNVIHESASTGSLSDSSSNSEGENKVESSTGTTEPVSQEAKESVPVTQEQKEPAP